MHCIRKNHKQIAFPRVSSVTLALQFRLSTDNRLSNCLQKLLVKSGNNQSKVWEISFCSGQNNVGAISHFYSGRFGAVVLPGSREGSERFTS